MKGIGMKRFSGLSVVAVIAMAMLAGCPAPDKYNTTVLKSPNTLDGSQVYFIPIAASKRSGDLTDYARLLSRSVDNNEVTALPSPTTGHEVVAFTNGVFKKTLSEGVYYFGVPYTDLYIKSDGSVGLGAPGGGNDTLANHFASPQISLLPVNASGAGATVTVGDLADEVVVTFSNVTVDNGVETPTSDNTFQVELFKTRGIDGDIALSYPIVDPNATGVVGLSNGELAGADQATIDSFVNGFSASDFTVAHNTEAVAAAS